MTQKLEERIRRAVAKMAREGITGWGLSVPAGMPASCSGIRALGYDSDTCHHYSHDPADADYRWLPPEGSQLTFLGYDGADAYYHVLSARRAEMFF